MKKFIIKILILIAPIIFIIMAVVYVDFFKIFGIQDYGSNQKIELNREMITTKTFNDLRKVEKYNSFIFGSSRSQAYKCENWETYLNDQAKPFHFDASGEGIWGVSKKVEYIDELNDTIKNALIIVDRHLLSRTYLKEGHMYIPMPCVSKLSIIKYYGTFLKASLHPKFLIANLDFSIFKTHREYMGHLIHDSKYYDSLNNRNCDVWYGYDKEIKYDSLKYYTEKNKKGVFFQRSNQEVSPCLVTPEETERLLSIKNIFTKHKTDYKIVISPMYDQIPMEVEQIQLLEDVFGKQNIYNFSGKNNFTNPIHNFYETSHYRPHVANEIMKIIYDK